MSCPLCQTPAAPLFYRGRQRPYLRCEQCRLIFVPPAYFLSAAEEKAEYDLHQNSPHDRSYRRFLSRLFDPIRRRLPPHSHGLDFGSGPGPTLSVMFEEIGHTVTIYDPFYAPDQCVFDRHYDFVTASEVVEHLHDPRAELERLWACLRPGGLLGLMTKLALDRTAFARWHYRQDRTHVCFYSRDTFHWLAHQWGAPVEFVGKDVILFLKPFTSQ